MNYTVNIPKDGSFMVWRLLPHGGSQRIDCEGVVIFDLWKVHDHRYCLQAFFYRRKVLIGYGCFGSKKELYGAIQNLLQKYL